MNQARHALAGCGTQTAALCIGGTTPPNSGLTESWNGTNWTEVSDLNTGRSYLAASIQGTPSTTLVYGGYTGGSDDVANTEEWNGVSWAEVNDLNSARYILSGSGTATAALAFGGEVLPPSSASNSTEEWTKPSNTVKTLTD